MIKLPPLSIPAILAALLLGLSGVAGADTLQMQGTTPDSSQAAHPTRGMTQKAVEAKFGQPVSVDAAVGDPPITRWNYANYIVYFEYDKVIHSVDKQ